jgi:aminoglycoside phosphotransferase (APT) family kinase protein
VELVAAGWDYTVHRVDGRWAFRFPRREIVLEPMQRELAVLGRLPPSLPVPRPVHRGAPSARFRWPFWGARWLPGSEAAAVPDAARHELAPQLAAALRRLHDSDLPDLPVDVQRRADMPFRVPRVRTELAAAASLWRPPAAVFDFLDHAERLPPPEAIATCHGDLHFRQLLVDEGRLTGIVDWVDVCRSDPGVDLQVYWSFVPPAARSEFLDEYGPVPQGSLLRARVLALFLNAALARYGRDEGVPSVEAEALAGLARTLS